MLSASEASNHGISFQLTEQILGLIQRGDSFQKLVSWLPMTVAKQFDLRGCQIELYENQQQQAKLVGGVGDGWLGPANQSRPITQLWDLYKPLTQGTSLQFSSQCLGTKKPSDASLTWLGCPIMMRTTSLGNMWVLRSGQRAFDGTESKQLCRLANYVAIALHQTHLEQTIDQQQTQIRQLRNAKDEFLQLISHELFIPLGSIQLSAQTLERIFKDASWRKVPQRSTVLKVLSLLSQECRRQKQFVDNLITLMFPEHQKASEPVLMNLSEWLPSLLRTFTTRLEQESLKLSITIPQEPLLFECDVTQLERVITELINNAIKYTPAKKTVKITVKAIDTAVEIAIANTGVQIPPSHQPYIFEKFYRVPEIDKQQYGGSGLGLALTKQLVINLGGTIELKSTRQKTTFTVKLPK
ncbi:sensor histidine kinase [Leptolyngbya sp. Heron Island J]|uniref:sensor histidine kinase n=1 Tax=Leptolyngbya sp. Heron Island J TaxID=1385935 RepID=UPI001378D657|nr:HAMP domain-containing sensor histidine kinase [Leptolyngbya sp. Heron Island J]